MRLPFVRPPHEPRVWAYLGKSLDRCSLSRLLRLGLGHLGLGQCILNWRSLDGLGQLD
ncbi:unnamed protein product [Spirodela intermedia]|uniref:Uncharacterized protein n=1 Tax=Spirodela intermedia TaxID=51605 RepID=A0A7I8IS12_SPIIN|nr:unnamed protein product [Spirodela intermedia]CAA6660788.1 unnamed protein product [Spirodela intermedia]